METEKGKVLVLCVDRDNDLGRKTGITGPVIGRKENIEAAKQLALADPEESDANTIFATVKLFDHMLKKGENAEIATVTGKNKIDFESDKEVSKQLDFLDSKIGVTGYVLVTDGSEDDQIIPLLQSRHKIISKKLVIIRQAKQVESTYYTIKEALKDPHFARIVFGIPGIVLLFYFATLYLEVPHLFLMGVALILGSYFVLRGFGIEQKILETIKYLNKSISLQRPSIIPYLAAPFFAGFGTIIAASSFVPSNSMFNAFIRALQPSYFMFVLAGVSAIIGRIMDAIHFRKGYKLNKYFLYMLSLFPIWLVVDAATIVFLGEENLFFFIIAVIVSALILLLGMWLSNALDLSTKISMVLIGKSVYDYNGTFLGKITKINKRKNSFYFSLNNKLFESKKGDFRLKEKEVIVKNYFRA